MSIETEKKILPKVEVRCGRYKHYKGGEYQVLGVARHSETEEVLVVYKQLDKDTGIWTRPHSMFFEKIIVDGVEKERFRFLHTMDGALPT